MLSMIETERLKLRPLRMSDAPRVARFCNDPGVAHMVWRVPLPYLEVAAEGWVMTLAARAPLGEDYVYAAELPGEGLVGLIGAHKSGGGRFEVGYWFGRPYWGKGLATETLTGFLSEARRLGALEAGHFVDNPAFRAACWRRADSPTRARRSGCSRLGAEKRSVPSNRPRHVNP